MTLTDALLAALAGPVPWLSVVVPLVMWQGRNLRREAILRNEKIDTKIDALKKEIDMQINNLAEKIDTLTKTVTEARKETRDDLHTLTERVETLNGNITRVGERVANIEGALKSQSQRRP